MAKQMEGIQITVSAIEADTTLHRLADRLLPWVPRLVPAILGGNLLPSSGYPRRSVIIPRSPGVGKDLTPEEVSRIHVLLPSLVRELPAGRQPLTNNEVDLNNVQIYRVKSKALFDRFVINRASADRLRRQNRTEDFMAKLPFALEAMKLRQFIPTQDPVTSDITAQVLPELLHNNVPAFHHQVQQALSDRTQTIANALNATWLERRTLGVPLQIANTGNIQAIYTGHDIQSVARNIAYEAEISRAISGRNPNIEVGGFMLAGLELLAAWLEEKRRWEWPDTFVDRLVGFYIRRKYPRRTIFGEHVQYQHIDQAVSLGKSTPHISTILMLWSLQTLGRESIYRRMANGNEDTRRRLTWVARESLMSDYSDMNKHRRSSRRQSLKERFPFG